MWRVIVLCRLKRIVETLDGQLRRCCPGGRRMMEGPRVHPVLMRVAEARRGKKGREKY